MGDCQLKLSEEKGKVQGTTLYTEGDCIQPTMVYLPKDHVKTSLNVILWLHGWWVKDFRRSIFGPDETGKSNNLREGVDKAGKDVVLIAPWCGYKYSVPDPANPKNSIAKGSLGLGNLAKDKGGIQPYLDQILGLVGKRLGDGALDSKKVERFVLACHSGGGDLMRGATPALGEVLGPKLKECWGFDCIYAPGETYGCWADSLPSQLSVNSYLYFYLAQGTLKYWRLFRDFWEFAYGTPSKPEPQRMNNVFLAPAQRKPALETLTDLEVFQSFEAIDLKQQQKQALTEYEALRMKLDPALFDKKGSWFDLVQSNLKGHYESVQDLLAPRIRGLFSTTKPSLGTNILAPLRLAACKKDAKTKAANPKKNPDPGKKR